MLFKEDLDQYDGNSRFICFYCDGNINSYSVFKKSNLKIFNDEVIRVFCNQQVEKGFKSDSEAINECKNRLRYLNIPRNLKIQKNKQRRFIIKKIINNLNKKQKK